MKNADATLNITSDLPAAGSRICVAYSGGLDSTVLLHRLHGLAAEHGYQLSAIHVHHGLNPLADDWATHCADWVYRYRLNVCRSPALGEA